MPGVVPPRHPTIAHALGRVRSALHAVGGAPVQGQTPPATPILVACSGGPDSVTMLGLLHLLMGPDNLRLVIAHCDHGLRAESVAEAELVRALGERLGLPVLVDDLELQPGPGLAARAREARRAALRRRAIEHGARFIALGHTATDQAETVLLHLCRGAGLPGLSGMPVLRPEAWSTSALVTAPTGWLRPMLELTRTQTRALATRLELPFVDDPTNVDVSHPRVRIRCEVLPKLAMIRDGVERAIATAAEHARDAHQALQVWITAEVLRRRGEIGWSIVGLNELPRAVRSGVLRSICAEEGVDLDALHQRTLAAIDAAVCEGGRRRRWDLHPGRRLHVDAGRVRVESVAATATGEEE